MERDGGVERVYRLLPGRAAAMAVVEWAVMAMELAMELASEWCG